MTRPHDHLCAGCDREVVCRAPVVSAYPGPPVCELERFDAESDTFVYFCEECVEVGR